MTDIAHHASRAELSRTLIVSTAIDVAREVGIFSLSMRAIAARHGRVAMALYGYVASKDDLLLAMVERLCGPDRASELPYPPDPDPLTEDLILAQRYLEIATHLHPHDQTTAAVGQSRTEQRHVGAQGEATP